MVRFLDWCRTHLSWHLSTLEDIGSILNGPLLLLAAIVAGVNQIMGGWILSTFVWIGFVWSVLQVTGIDLQYMACARRIKDAVVTRRYFSAGLWILLTALLALPVLLANLTFTLQLMLGWTEAQAMEFIALTPLMVAIGRAVLQLILSFVSAITRETRHPAEYSVPAPLVIPPPDKGRRVPTTRTRSHSGTTRAQQLATKETRLKIVEGMLRNNNQVSVGMVAEMLNLKSNSQASALLDTARARYQAG